MMNESLSFKLENFEGPLDLLLALVEKHKLNIEDIPIDTLCEQYMASIRDAQERSIDVACDFLLMASELMLIKSRMLLPRSPDRDADPRQPLVDALLEYQRAKLAAAELSDLYLAYGSRMVKEQDDVSPDRTYVSEHDTALLRAALAHIFTETRMTEKTAREEFSVIVNAPRIPVETVMNDLIGTLRSGPVRLDGYLRASAANRPELVAKFLGILELLRSGLVALEDETAPEDGVTDLCAPASLRLIADEETIASANLDFYA